MNLRLVLVGFLLLLAGCSSLPREQREWVSRHVQESRTRSVAQAAECAPLDCAVDSPLLREAKDLLKADAASPKHVVHLLDYGQDSLLARVHLIRSARHSIELQTFIFDDDDSGRLVLAELRAAARRGVKVRILLDQLYGLPDPNLQAALATFHANFELRLYNPTFGEARTQDLEFAAGIICCFNRFNQRMHSKLLLVDDAIGVLGGRNFQDRYFDWSATYNYRDRDVLIAGPVARDLKRNFDAFWVDPQSVPSELLKDVQERLIKHQGAPPGRLIEREALVPRAIALNELAANGETVRQRLQGYRYEVGEVEFFADLPEKHADSREAYSAASSKMSTLLRDTQQELVLQTPYLVLSREARRLFRDIHRRKDAPDIVVSTNSLAATDAFPVYAMSHKYKRLYLRELGFRIFEFKPFPASAPLDIGAMQSGRAEDDQLKVLGSGSSGSRGGVVPLRSAGIRVGLHSKSFVIDGHIGVVGSHNFDPRSDNYNTESLLVVHDEAFAQALKRSIEVDMAADNAWTIAPKPKPRFVGQLSYNLDKISEKLPLFDLWPFSYASSYQLKPGCMPLRQGHPRFHECYEDAGDFPEVDLPGKTIYTRLLKAFGAGLVPIL